MRRGGRVVAALLTSQWQRLRATERSDDRGVGTLRRKRGRTMTVRLHSPESFLWTNELPERHLKVRQGEILVAPLAAGKAVPDGLIYHWGWEPSWLTPALASYFRS
jgi:hypothetical protein